MNRPLRVSLAAALALVVAGAACAPTAIRLPEGPWAPDPQAMAVFADATQACRGIRTLTAELGVAGRADGSAIRGRLLAGYAAPGRVRLEGLAPFGAPAFVLTSVDDRAVLVLPRDRRVLRDAPLADVLEALSGIRLDADDLAALIGGCVVHEPVAVQGRRHPSGWLAADLADGLSVYLRRQDARWRVVRAARGEGSGDVVSRTVEYGRYVSSFPSMVRLMEARASSDGGRAATDVRLTISQLDVNIAVSERAFDAAPHEGFLPVTLDELRTGGPLADPTAPRR